LISSLKYNSLCQFIDLPKYYSAIIKPFLKSIEIQKVKIPYFGFANYLDTKL
jgi:hypothetical protein